MIKMTWPQFKRRECTITARLSGRETAVLSTLLMHHPEPVKIDDLIEVVWPDPDVEPEWAKSQIYLVIKRLRAKIGVKRILTDSIGYRLNPSGDRRYAD